MPTETWTGADGSAWPAEWVLGLNSSNGGLIQIIGNAGEMGSGNAGGFSGADRNSRRYTTTSYTDTDAYIRYRFIDGGGFIRLYARADEFIRTEKGYGIDISTSQVRILRSEAFSSTVLSTEYSFSHVNGTWYRLRMRVAGGTVEFKHWADNASEPSSWTRSAVDATPLSAGFIGLTMAGDSAAISYRSQFDDFSFSDGTKQASALFSSTTSLTATPTVTTPPVRQATVNFQASTTLTALPTVSTPPVRSATATFSPVATLSVAAPTLRPQINVAALFTATPNLTATPMVARSISVVFAVAASFVARFSNVWVREAVPGSIWTQEVHANGTWTPKTSTSSTWERL